MSDISSEGRVIPVAIEDEVKESYLNYAMSVIVSRALPDVRDGLKPVHRRILFGMHEMGLRADRPFKKAARIVGDVLGKYHPHGDQSVYDALVRLAQTFSLRYPVVNGQGNFGSVDGDPPAAMRYTEARMTRLAEEMLRDINKETVDFGPNYDDSTEEPLVLPAAFPFLLANGASGIAVGMATNLPPHNLREIAAAVGAVIDNPNIGVEQLMKFISGPDFPTGGIIYGTRGIRSAYRTGRGRIVVRARFVLEENKRGRDVIVVNEIPYMVNKAALVTRIAELVHDRKIDGIADLRDESDRNGMRIVIELKKGVSPKVILNQLFTHTQLQVNFNVNALALVHGRPQVLTLREMIQYFINHRHEVIVRRTKYDLRKAEEREHILEGLKIALDNIDEVIRTIRESADVDTARTSLMERFGLTEIQAQAILDMRLQRLTSLETQKIIDELEQVRALIRELRELLASESKIRALIKAETQEIADKYGDERRTAIELDEIEEIDIEDLIQKQDMVVLISSRGFIKRVAFNAYTAQGRGGKGSLSSGNLREDDFIEHVFVASTHSNILFFTSVGKAYYLKVHEIPEAARTAKGTHVKALMEISADEDVSSVVAVKDFNQNAHVLFATSAGQLVKVPTAAFVNAKRRGIRAIGLREGDTLVTAFITQPNDEVFIVSRHGQAARINESTIREVGRGAQGVRGLRLKDGDELTAATIASNDPDVLLVTQQGYGKRTAFEEFAVHNRGVQGVRAYSVSEETGEVTAAVPVSEGDEIIAVTSQGKTVRLKTDEITRQGRTARGVRVMTVMMPDYVTGVAKLTIDEEEEQTATPVETADETADADGEATAPIEESESAADDTAEDADE